MSVCARGGPVNQTSLKRLKLRISNLTRTCQRQFRHDPLKIFEKGAWLGSRDPLNFGELNANSSSKMVKVMDFKFVCTVQTLPLTMLSSNFDSAAHSRKVTVH